MIHMMVAVWGGCFVLSLLLTGLYLYALKNQFQSARLQTLNTNLLKVGLFWSNADSNFKELRNTSVQDDQKGLYRSVIVMGAVLSVLSVIGFVLLVLIVLSTRYLARSRLETAVFHSPLTELNSLSAQQVTGFVEELKLIR